MFTCIALLWGDHFEIFWVWIIVASSSVIYNPIYCITIAASAGRLTAAEWQDTLPRESEELCPSLVSTLQAYLQGQRHRLHLQNLGQQIWTSDFWWLNARAIFLDMPHFEARFKYCFWVPNQANGNWNLVNFPPITVLLTFPHVNSSVIYIFEGSVQLLNLLNNSNCRKPTGNCICQSLVRCFKYFSFKMAWTHTVKYWKQFEIIWFYELFANKFKKIKIYKKSP